MDQVVLQFQKIVLKLSGWRLRQRLVLRKDDRVINFIRDVHHVVYRMPAHLLLHRRPLPTPNTPKVQ